jgi:hypothetical protein
LRRLATHIQKDAHDKLIAWRKFRRQLKISDKKISEEQTLMTVASTVTRAEVRSTRWGYVAICVICMVMIANLQYGWTLFVNPLNKAHGWSVASIQFAFAIFIALETWLTPIEGWIVDVLGPERGPKIMVSFGGIAVALGWVINAYASSLVKCSISAPSSRESAAARFTRPVSGWRSNGFPIGADWRSA